MRRCVWLGLLVAGLAAWALLPGESAAQSKKKMSTEKVTIAGASSAIFEHWKKDAKPDKGVVVKFDLGKPKEMEKSDTAELTVIKVEGKKSVEELLSDEKQLIKDEKATIRGPSDYTAGTLKGKQIYIVGTPAGKSERFRLVTTVLDTKDGMYVVRLYGPSPLLGVHQPDVDQFMKAFK